MQDQTLQQNVPKLRFPEFEGEWERTKLGDVVSLSSGGTPSKDNPDYWDGDVPWISAASMHTDKISDSELKISKSGLENGSRLAKKGDILLLVRGSMLFKRIPAGICSQDVAFNQDVKCIKPSNYTSSEFLIFSIRANENELLFRVTGTGIGAGKLDTTDLRNYYFSFPKLPEQTKIASFLSAVDDKIQQLEKRKALLQDYKKGCMQQIFSQKIRFKDDKGNEFPDWEETKLNQFLYEPKERNRNLAFDKTDVLSVSGEYGCVNQIDFMGRSYAGASVAEYHVVKKDDVVYTKSPLKNNPYGIIKTNKGLDGIVSTLYAVYRPTDRANSFFIDYYFQLDDNLNRYLRPIVRKGAKNDMKVNNSDVLSDPVIFPSLNEQQKIADFLSAIDTKIELASQKLAQSQAFKKGLLQQMFV